MTTMMMVMAIEELELNVSTPNENICIIYRPRPALRPLLALSERCECAKRSSICSRYITPSRFKSRSAIALAEDNRCGQLEQTDDLTMHTQRTAQPEEQKTLSS